MAIGQQPPRVRRGTVRWMPWTGPRGHAYDLAVTRGRWVACGLGTGHWLVAWCAAELETAHRGRRHHAIAARRQGGAVQSGRRGLGVQSFSDAGTRRVTRWAV